MISDGFWSQRFNGDPNAIGATIKVDERHLHDRRRARARASVSGAGRRVRAARGSRPSGRRGGPQLPRDRAAERRRDRRAGAGRDPRRSRSGSSRQYPDTNKNKHATVVPLKDLARRRQPGRRSTCSCTASVGRAADCLRQRRQPAAGAGVGARPRDGRARGGRRKPRRLIRQLLTESLRARRDRGARRRLAGAAGSGGADGAGAGRSAARRRGPRRSVGAAVRRCSLRLAASIVFGLAPALQTSRVQLATGLREGGKGTSIGARGGWAAQRLRRRRDCAGGGAGRRRRAARAEPGGAGRGRHGLQAGAAARAEHPVSVRTFEEAPRATAFYRDLLADVRALPGVDAAGGVTSMPTADALERHLRDRRLDRPASSRHAQIAAGHLQRRDARLLPDAAACRSRAAATSPTPTRATRRSSRS